MKHRCPECGHTQRTLKRPVDMTAIRQRRERERLTLMPMNLMQRVRSLEHTAKRIGVSPQTLDLIQTLSAALADVKAAIDTDTKAGAAK